MWNRLDECIDIISQQYKVDAYDKLSGKDETEIRSVCDAIFAKDQSFGKSKSEVMAYILENCRVDICTEELFADKFTCFDIVPNRLWHSDLSKFIDVVNDRITDAGVLIKSCAIEPSTDYGHLAPDWKFVIENGIPGIIERLERYCSVCKPEKAEFYENSLRVYRAIIVLLNKFADSAKRIGTEKMIFVADNMIALTQHAPKTLAQAMQLTLIIYTVQTKLELSTVRSLGGLDRLYGDLYLSDIASGRFTDEQLREITRDFLYKISLMKVAANMPFYICGRFSNGEDATNAFTKVLLEEYRKLDIYDPKIHVMYHNGIDQSIIKLIVDMIKEGKNSFVFINIDVAEKALENIGIEHEDAKKVIVYGCYETASEGEEIPSTCAGRINMPKILDMFIHGGKDILKGIHTEYKPSTEFSSFEEFYEAFKSYLKYCIIVCMKCISGYETYYKDVFMAPVLSATFESSVRNGIDIFSKGAKYNNTSIVCSCQASVVDSLVAIKKLVFEEKLISLKKLREIMSSNWETAPELRSKCLGYPKFANNEEEADNISVSLNSFLADEVINGYKNGRGGIFRYGNFSIDWRFRFGKATAALPDGHLCTEPLSKNFSASIGMDKKGVTSFINSVLKMDASKIPDGCVADIVLHSSCTNGEEGSSAIIGLITSFMNCGGFAIQFNVLSSEILRLAQKTPEKYKNLQIRVCGWNANFVNLSKTEQDEFIIQSEQ